jgi:glycosyltransferase involved in cell wall biosynthesis
MTLGEFMAANLEKQFDSKRTRAGRVQIIYPWADVDRIKPIDKEKNWFAGEYQQLAKLTIMYSGNMGLGHDIETMLEAAKGLQDMPDVCFMFIGAGPKWHLVKDMIDNDGLSNVILLPWQLEDVLPFSLATADIALISLEKELTGLAVPSKAIYALAAGSAVVALACQSGELRSWLQTHDCGVAIDPGDSVGLEKVFRRLADDCDELHHYSDHARRAAEKVFSRSVNSRRIAELIA